MSIYSQSVVMYVIIWEQFVTWGEMSVGGGGDVGMPNILHAYIDA